MAEVPRTKRSEYSGAHKDLQEQIDELRRKIEEIQARDQRYATIFREWPTESLPKGCTHLWTTTTGGNVCQRCGARE